MGAWGALVREEHPLYVGEGEEEASATFMQEEREREGIDLHVRERWASQVSFIFSEWPSSRSHCDHSIKSHIKNA